MVFNIEFKVPRFKSLSQYRSEVKLSHPESADLAFLYGTILTDGRDDMSSDSTCNICIFAKSQASTSKVSCRTSPLLSCRTSPGVL